jgi:hypothetical protein
MTRGPEHGGSAHPYPSPHTRISPAPSLSNGAHKKPSHTHRKSPYPAPEDRARSHRPRPKYASTQSNHSDNALEDAIADATTPTNSDIAEVLRGNTISIFHGSRLVPAGLCAPRRLRLLAQETKIVRSNQALYRAGQDRAEAERRVAVAERSVALARQREVFNEGEVHRIEFQRLLAQFELEDEAGVVSGGDYGLDGEGEEWDGEGDGWDEELGKMNDELHGLDEGGGVFHG